MRSTSVGRSGILHIHYATAAFGYAAARTPLVVHCHGTDVRGMRGVRRQLLGGLFRRSALVLVATPDLREFVPDAIYLPNPVDTEVFRPSGGARRDVLVFSTLTDIKGGDTLVAAVSELRRSAPDVSVTALDIGPYANAMRAAGAMMLPPQDAAALPRLIGDHRIIVGQQRIGALGASELQALSSGKPTICHVRLEQYDEAPPIQPSDSAADIVRLVVQLLDDDERRSVLGAQGRDWIERVHSLETVTGQLLDHYRTAGIVE